MIQSKDIDAIMGADVVDSDDDRIGKVSQVYVDSHDQHPSWIAVKTGFFGSAETLVPIEDAAWDSSKLHVGVSKATVHDAPHVDPDREITVDEQNRLYQHYGIGAQVDPQHAPDDSSTAPVQDTSAQRGAIGTRDSGIQDAPPRQDAPAQDATVQDTAVRDAGGSSDAATASAATEPVATDPVPTEPAASDLDPDDSYRAADQVAQDGSPVVTAGENSDASTTEPTASAEPGGTGATPVDTGRSTEPTAGETATARAGIVPAHSTRADDAAEAAGTPIAGAGYRMRLRKVTVTEQRTVTVTVPVTHEEVRLERVPDDEPDGPDVIQGETDVVLMAEQPVVTTQQVPVERVHVSVDPVTDGERAGS